MRTIKSLKEELNKFPNDAVCYAYDSVCVIRGLVILPSDYNNDKNKKRGYCDSIGEILCNHSYSLDVEPATLYK
jgi:hypothetical protein